MRSRFAHPFGVGRSSPSGTPANDGRRPQRLNWLRATRCVLAIALAQFALPALASESSLAELPSDSALSPLESAPSTTQSSCATVLSEIGDASLKTMADYSSIKGNEFAECDILPSTKLDLLVMYDAALLATYTRATVESWIQESVIDANLIFEESGAGAISYELTMREVSLPEPATGSDLSPIRVQRYLREWSINPNSLPARLRAYYGADMAVLVTTPDPDFACGVANVPVLVNGQEVEYSTGTAFAQRAFAVIEYGCGEGVHNGVAANDFTLAHELGHTFGMIHSESEVVPRVLPYASGHTFVVGGGADGTKPRRFATVMNCEPDPSRPGALGSCRRILHFSNPDVLFDPGGTCSGAPCNPVPTGTATRNNALVACMRAPGYAQFGTPDANLPPTVRVTSPAAGQSFPSGTLISVSATATDPEQGSLAASVVWLDQHGTVLGSGANTTVRPYVATNYLVARVTDSAGQTDEWWHRTNVVYAADAYEPDSEATHAIITLGNAQLRNFHTTTDLDIARTQYFVNGTRARIRVEAIGNRVAPQLEIARCSQTNCGAYASSSNDIVMQAAGGASVEGFKMRVRDSLGRAGTGTEYRIRVDTPPPAQAVFPLVGSWWNPSRSGNGLDLQRTVDGNYVATWYTYRSSGTPIWYISDPAPVQGNQWQATLRSATWTHPNGPATLVPVGTLSFNFSSATGATFSYLVNGISGSESFESYLFGNGGTGPLNGLWYPPSQSGWGQSVWHRGSTAVVLVASYDSTGQPTWVQGAADATATGATFDIVQTGNGFSRCPGCTGSTPVSVSPVIGTATLDVPQPGTNSGWFSINVNYASASGSWNRSVPINRIAGE